MATKTSSTSPRQIGFPNVLLLLLSTAVAILAINQFSRIQTLQHEKAMLQYALMTSVQNPTLHARELSDQFEKGYLASAWDMYKKVNHYAFTEEGDGSVTVWRKEAPPVTATASSTEPVAATNSVASTSPSPSPSPTPLVTKDVKVSTPIMETPVVVVTGSSNTVVSEPEPSATPTAISTNSVPLSTHHKHTPASTQ